ncbi:inositol monophosphatase [Marinomonas sp. M1K-6]|uniref:Inositol monophosphatase n=1 Tax=Marinomonas profundi TaxID=2726122 RepID=A0A847R8C6_9GAMM|nr:inositol monophosphatase [Marinomonas profundi]NLQ18326.1 inositol monophosphatase [Marinomonas profundi]UDV02389.1 inositol monophosphatase [Marinomonas profundi]
MLTRKQKSEMVEIVRDVAKVEVLPRFRRLSEGAISSKTSFDDLVTEADVASEKALTQRFQALLPHAIIIGEEAVSEDESVLDQIDTDGLVIIIDPIDGTWNFAHGLATFGVLIAAIYQGKTVYGLLYDPLNDDWIEASLGEGAWYVRPDQSPRRLILSDQPVDSNLVGFFSPFLFEDSAARERAALQQVSYARSSSLRCCCHEYRTMVQNGVDFFISPKPKVWDHAAGILAYQEAGGHVCMLDGTPYKPMVRTGVIIAARTEVIRDRIRKDFSFIV